MTVVEWLVMVGLATVLVVVKVLAVGDEAVKEKLLVLLHLQVAGMLVVTDTVPCVVPYVVGMVLLMLVMLGTGIALAERVRVIVPV